MLTEDLFGFLLDPREKASTSLSGEIRPEYQRDLAETRHQLGELPSPQHMQRGAQRPLSRLKPAHWGQR